MEKPNPFFGLIKDVLHDVGRGAVAILVAYFDCSALVCGHVTIVVDQLPDHLFRQNEVRLEWQAVWEQETRRCYRQRRRVSR